MKLRQQAGTLKLTESHKLSNLTLNHKALHEDRKLRGTERNTLIHSQYSVRRSSTLRPK
jgi:hypothetical protein